MSFLEKNHSCEIYDQDGGEVHSVEIIDENGDKIHIAKGLNGILYRLVECTHNPTHTNTYPTTFDREEIRRKFDRTFPL